MCLGRCFLFFLEDFDDVFLFFVFFWVVFFRMLVICFKGESLYVGVMFLFHDFICL